MSHLNITFVGGGNMATALIGGLIQQGHPADLIAVVEPNQEARMRLNRDYGLCSIGELNDSLVNTDVLVWAVKPQALQQAITPYIELCTNALHLSVAAGIRAADLARWLKSDKVVRAMPNTPALVGKGTTGLFALATVTAKERAWVDAVIRPTGQLLWVEEEALLDAVTALSGSGPAYVFYFLEAMIHAGECMGLSSDQAKQLALGTFAGATALAQASSDTPATLREKVTSKGGTTFAALEALKQANVAQAIEQAMFMARRRAIELGDEFGR